MKQTEAKTVGNIDASAVSSPLPKSKKMFRPELGEVMPTEGWLLHQLEYMTSGITGRLNEYGPFFTPEKDGFIDPEVRGGWEEVPYWLRGAYPLAVLTGNKRLLDLTQRYFEVFFATREDDGWFGPRYLKSFETIDGIPVPDVFPHMILLDPIILYYEHTKDERALELIDKFLTFCANIPDKAFMPAHLTRIKWQKIRAGDMLENIYWYYRKTGKEWLLELAERFHGAIWKSEMKYIAHHAVDFAQRFAYDAIYSQQSGDEKNFEASEEAYRIFKADFGDMPRGIFAADEQIREGCNDPRQGYEPCGMVELSKNFYELARISGNTLYGDRIEDVMLNHFAPSFTEDYKQLHYLTCCNLPKLSKKLGQPTTNGSFADQKSYEIMTPNNRCCGHNTGMGWPYYAMNLWQKSADGGIVAMIYAPSKLETVLNGEKIALQMQTAYPFREDLKVTVTRGGAGAFPIYFRIPGWSRKTSASVNGKEVLVSELNGGYVRLMSEWQTGDVISIEFSAEISFTRWKNGSVSVDRGPFTYSLRLPEIWEVVPDSESFAYRHPKNHIFENLEAHTDADWNFGLCLGDDINDCVKLVSRSENIADQPFSERSAPIVLSAKVRKINEWGLEDDMAGELMASPAYTTEPERCVELIPLGCARLRISCFPTVTDDEAAGNKWTETPSHTLAENRVHRYPTPYKESEYYSAERKGS